MVALLPALAMCCATTAAGSNSTAMAPGTCSASTWRVRSTTMCKASRRLSTPATCAAAYSPRLWPSTAMGVMPHDRHNAASAISTATNAGWP